MVDSGATHHITSDLANLALHQTYTAGEEVSIGDANGFSITNTGSAILPSSTRPLSLNNVLCVPAIKKNLISVYKLCNANRVSVQFYSNCFQVISARAPLLQGRTKDELYEWPTSLPKTFLTTTINNKTTVVNWHSRLGHPSPSILKTIISRFSLPTFDSMSSPFHCGNCLSNKSQKLSFSQTTLTSTRPLQVLFSDVWISPITSIDNFKYHLIIVDQFSRYIWLYPLKLKSQVRKTFIRLTNLVENRFQTKIGTLFSDNGGEFIALLDFLASKCITYLTSPPHTPEHNGLAERRHRHIVETGLTLLHQSSVPNIFWPYAFATAVYLINRMPSQTLSLQSPLKVLFKIDPNYTKLRIFGSTCYPWLRPYTRNKLESRSKPCVFMGYSLTQSAYLCFYPQENRLYTSRHVRFDETKFPLQNLSHPTNTANTETIHSAPPFTIIPTTLPLIDAQSMAPPASSARVSSSDTSPPSSPSVQQSPHPSALSPVADNAPTSPATSTSSSATSVTQSSGSVSNDDNIASPSPKLSPNTNNQNQTHQAQQGSIQNPPPQEPINRHQMTTRSKNNITKPKQNFSLIVKLFSFKDTEPRTLNQALKSEHWRRSMST